MDKFLEELLRDLGPFAIGAVALTWFAKKVVQFLLDQDIEVYKAKLAKESEKEVNLFRTRLQMAARERHTRYTALHDKRMEITHELYTRLRDVYDRSSGFALKVGTSATWVGLLSLMEEDDSSDVELDLKDATKELAGEKDKATEIWESIIRTRRFFNKHRLYFSKGLSEQIEDLLLTLQQVPVSYVLKQADEETLTEEMREALSTWEEQEPAIKEVLEMIEDEFRQLLGSEEQATLTDEKASTISSI